MAPTASLKAPATSGDALEDNFELDNDILLADGDSDVDEQDFNAAGPSSGRAKRKSDKQNSLRPVSPSEEDEFALDDDDFDGDGNGDDDDNLRHEQDKSAPVNKKRKLANGQNSPQADTALSAADKKRRRKDKTKEAKRKKTQLIDEAEDAVDTSLIAVQPPQLQADFLAEMQALGMPKLSFLESEEFRISESMLVDTSDITERKSLTQFIQSALKLYGKDLQIADDTPAGTPRLLVVNGAALRIADAVRDLRSLVGKAEVAKLFAKHFKLAEHIEYCKKTKFVIGAGTPDRIQKLIEADSLSISQLTYLILDTTKDSKKRNLLDIPESRASLFKLLSGPAVSGQLQSGRLKLVLF